MKQIQTILKGLLNWRWLVLISITVLAIYSFLELAEDVWLKEGFTWDIPIILRINQFSTPSLDFIFRIITNSAGSFILISIGIIAYWFWRNNLRYQIAMLIFSVLGMGVITTLLKWLVQRPRPDVFIPLVNEASYSFPSGHTGAAVALFGLAGVYFWKEKQRLLASFCWFWVFLVMLSRIYLGAHYPSDVLASLALGIIWVILLTIHPFAKGLNLD